MRGMKDAMVKTALLLFMIVAGCQNLPAVSESEQAHLLPHYIFIDRDGFALAPNQTPLTTPEFRDHLTKTILSGLGKRAQALKDCSEERCRTLKLLVFVHGGMNGYDDDFARMRRFLETDSGTRHLPGLFTASSTEYYPIFINWNSEPVDATIDDLFRIRFAERHSLWLTIPTLPFVLIGRTAASIGDMPVSLVHIGFNIKEAFLGALESGDSKACAVADTIAYAPLLPVYAVTAPLLEGFGTPAWKIMKRRAELAVANRLPQNEPGAVEGAARTLMATLAEYVKTLPVPVEVTLVGHSMGSILLNR